MTCRFLSIEKQGRNFFFSTVLSFSSFASAVGSPILVFFPWTGPTGSLTCWLRFHWPVSTTPRRQQQRAASEAKCLKFCSASQVCVRVHLGNDYSYAIAWLSPPYPSQRGTHLCGGDSLQSTCVRPCSVNMSRIKCHNFIHFL